MHIAYSPISANKLVSPFFRSLSFFGFPYFDHDEFTHHALHVAYTFESWWWWRLQRQQPRQWWLWLLAPMNENDRNDNDDDDDGRRRQRWWRYDRPNYKL